MPSTRREFLTRAAAVAAVTIVPRHVLGGAGHVAPSDKVNVAIVGAGGQGRTNLRELFKLNDCQVIAVADPIEHEDLERFYFKGVAGREPVRAEIEQHYSAKTPNFRCAAYEDFRDLLEKEKAVDAVLCATPDHVHAYVSVLAMRAGKHVYCEKPLTHSISEARTVARVAKETGVATQMGNQGHSTEGIRQTCEWIWEGLVGPVREVHAWVPAGRWNKQLLSRPSDTPPVPPGVNWDLWLGPREPRPYHPAYVPVTWRDFWAFGCGVLGDFGCHDLDAACWALDLHAPLSVECCPAGPTDAEIGPHGSIGYLRFGPRGDQPAVNVTWYDGGLRPPCPEELGEGGALPARGVLFVGEKGRLLCGGAGGPPQLLPADRDRQTAKPGPSIPRSRGHHRDWLDACKGSRLTGSSFEYGARLTEIVLLGVASLRLGKKLDWDAVAMKARGLPDADAVFDEPRRKGWELTS